MLFYCILDNAAYYEDGVTFADGRINENSASYTAGYIVGKQNELIFLGNERNYNIAEFVGPENVRNYKDNDFFVTYGQGCPFTRITLFSYSGETEFTWTYNSSTGTLTVNGGVASYSYSDRGYDIPATMELLPAVYMFK